MEYTNVKQSGNGNGLGVMSAVRRGEAPSSSLHDNVCSTPHHHHHPELTPGGREQNVCPAHNGHLGRRKNTQWAMSPQQACPASQQQWSPPASSTTLSPPPVMSHHQQAFCRLLHVNNVPPEGEQGIQAWGTAGGRAHA